MTRARALLGLARRFPLPFRVLLQLSLKGYLPLAIYDHWLGRMLARQVWPRGPSWLGRTVRLPNGMQIELDPRDYIGRTILTSGYYDLETIHFFHRYLRPGMTYLDVGAHIGQHTLVASHRVGPSGAVHSFEPNPLLYDVLRRNVKLNQCSNVILNNVAIGDHQGISHLVLADPEHSGTSFLTSAAGNGLGTSVSVPTTALDTYADARSLLKIDMIKVDIEGAELSALCGAARVLERNPDVVLVVEFCEDHARRFGHSTADVADYLHDAGFRLFHLRQNGLEPLRPGEDRRFYFNVIAARPHLVCGHGDSSTLNLPSTSSDG